ncbi:class I SAM-dependent methyltransferase [Cedecea davisae]|uniref:Class I SAM-dependent methyltransferase n=1 Tax=Cedecea davisae TaxID=158484 RepID=A0ABS6DI85_9ENTR|nr:class I SAM-dependent methyltransferase [Cedecea davisae]EBF4840413.1 class I SAM-dependent methyltransferase [Salmonella enterica]MBU4682931.1 class I SAM-dependent methyltransferase [Cedecea davisae]MBU4687970.1 class I SAM-dependent methyltransferase [Cedecea davisae]
MKKIIPLEEGRALFGSNYEAYCNGRPDYPNRVYELISEHCDNPANSRMFEIGPGNGQATQSLLKKGFKISAIEPDVIFSQTLQQHLGSLYPQSLAVIPSSFEEAKFEETAFDIGIAATSFHWIDPARGLDKCFQILRPGGWFAMWWTVFGDPNNMDAFQRRTGKLFEPLEVSPSHKAGFQFPFALQKEEREAELAKAGFINLQHENIPWGFEMNARQTQLLLSTFSPVSRLSEAERMSFLSEIGRIVNEEFGGFVERNFVTAVYLGQKPIF